VPSLEELGAVHFIGIGGAGMSGIARILLARGVPVSGSDRRDTPTLLALRALGARVEVGHDPAHLGDADTVVVSTAIRADNPELVAARERGLRVLPRAVGLAAVMAGRRSIAVAGTHGKTSTTSMLTVAVQACGVDPSFAVGGDLNESGSNAHAGEGDVFVAEADESDRSFLLLAPFAGIVTNVEADHLDNYGDLAAVEAAFDRFLHTVHPDGFVVVCADDPGAARLRTVPTKARLRSYGRADDADLRLLDLQVAQDVTSYTAVLDGHELGRVRIQVPGEHMALNSAAALLAGLELGLPAEGLVDGLARFGGVHRRFELKGVAGGVRVYDDYAHHPTEVSAQLRAARAVAGDGRLVVAFQPHLYSRTREFAEAFGRALGLADEVVVMEIYGAREDPVPGITGAMVAEAVPLPPERVLFEPSWSAAAPALAQRARAGDLVMTMGAGDVSMVGPEVLAALRAAEG
jgi:UDP-N-acetylmuramate--alanine ligase